MVQNNSLTKFQTLMGICGKLLYPWGVNETLHDSVYLLIPLLVSCSFCDTCVAFVPASVENGLRRQMHSPGFTSRTTFQVVHINRCQNDKIE